MLKQKSKSFKYYEWSDLQNGVSKLLGKDICDYAQRYKDDKLNADYQNFWHWWIDRFEVTNGSYGENVNFKDILNDWRDNLEATKPWVIEILEGFIKVLGKNGDKDITIHYYW